MYILGASSQKTNKLFYHYLYDSCNYCLKRKFNKFSHYINTEKTQLITEYRNAQEMSNNNNSPKSTDDPIQD